MDTNSFIINIKTKDAYKDSAKVVDNRFDTSNYELNRPLPTGKNKKMICLMKDELREKIMTEFVALRPKGCSYLMNDGNNDKKNKRNKKMYNKTKT